MIERANRRIASLVGGHMRLLVTGGAGFIGSAVVRHCLRHTGYDVVNVDNLTYAANLENLDAVLPHPRYRFIKADIADAEAMRRVFTTYDPDGVIHLAAETHVDRSIDGPSAFIQTNIVGTYALLSAARLHWENLASHRKSRFRFLHVSTDEVFGTLGTEGHFTETTALPAQFPLFGQQSLFGYAGASLVSHLRPASRDNELLPTIMDPFSFLKN